MTLNQFLSNLNDCSQILSRGNARVLDTDFSAALVRNLYGQEIVWGDFGFERRKNGTFKKWTGLANNANTEDVVYEAKNS